jgi:hypothetical protein
MAETGWYPAGHNQRQERKLLLPHPAAHPEARDAEASRGHRIEHASKAHSFHLSAAGSACCFFDCNQQEVAASTSFA